MPAFWMTINPSDLRNPLVLTLAGVECAEDTLPTAIGVEESYEDRRVGDNIPSGKSTGLQELCASYNGTSASAKCGSTLNH